MLTTIQERIKLVLLSLARDATLAALEDMQGRIALLSARPSQLDGYMGYLVGWHLQGRVQCAAVASQSLCAAIAAVAGCLQAQKISPPTPAAQPALTATRLQVMHTQQVEDRKQLVASCAQIDDMYDSLAAHEQKVGVHLMLGPGPRCLMGC